MHKKISTKNINVDEDTHPLAKQKHYCKNADLLREIMEYQKTKVISNKLGEYLMAIAWHLTGHSNFRQYSFGLKEDFVGAALVRMVKGVAKFNPEKSNNPFAYFTQICWNSFIYSCKEYYKQINIKKDILENYLITAQSTKEIDPNSLVEMFINNLLDYNDKKDKDKAEEEALEEEVVRE